jgi:hypothetical protein
VRGAFRVTNESMTDKVETLCSTRSNRVRATGVSPEVAVRLQRLAFERVTELMR